MKAIVKKEAKPGLWLEEVDKPKPRDNEVLIQVKKASICGTDMHIYEWDDWAQKTVPTPITIGHEFMGHIVEIGGGVTHYKVGDRVSVEGRIGCARCRNCLRGLKNLCIDMVGIGVKRNGGFADFVAVPEENVFLLDPVISDEVGSILDPFGNAVHMSLAFDLVGEDVWVVGAGPIGLMACAIAKKAGAKTVVASDLHDYRLKLAKEMGATHTINVKHESIEEVMKKAGIKVGFDVALESAGSGVALNSIFKYLMRGGKAALLGIMKGPVETNWNDIVMKGYEIKGISGRIIFETWYKGASLLKAGLNIEKIITHRFPKEDFEKAFETIREGKCGKVVLDWEN